jgi:hypothetical protein
MSKKYVSTTHAKGQQNCKELVGKKLELLTHPILLTLQCTNPNVKLLEIFQDM